jgi:hypothetical protein
VQFLHNLGIREACDELASKNFSMTLGVWEGLFEQRPHSAMEADDGLVLLLHPKIECASSLFHEGGADEDLT